ncbi:hypothetical protein FQN57_007232 [Myotisia sp. PD_48]|nr:hypothetical protein FQN57_007232 [Myotisia sp. PD_48]
MKFAKELEEELVPEWRAKYLNYKVGKKKVKAIARALRHVDQATWAPGRRGGLAQTSLRDHDFPNNNNPTAFYANNLSNNEDEINVLQHYAVDSGDDVAQQVDSGNSSTRSLSLPPQTRHLFRPPSSRFTDQYRGYGSIVRPGTRVSQSSVASSLNLPGPALDPNDGYFTASHPDNSTLNQFPPAEPSPGRAANARVVKERHNNTRSGILPGPRNIFNVTGNHHPAVGSIKKPHLLKRMFSTRLEHDSPRAKAPMQALSELRTKEDEFFFFLDKELVKIESFYKMKEGEATKRLFTLRQQLHVMRDVRLEELRDKRRQKYGSIQRSTKSKKRKKLHPNFSGGKPDLEPGSFISPELLTPPVPRPSSSHLDARRDFVARRDNQGVPYSVAKKKLKLALLEYYRGLELLKAYILLNRKAFRKMNKKYDKVTNSRPTGRYLSEKVNKAWFVQSDVLENHLVAVEDLYTRYFERGNRKAAVGKLRGNALKSHDYSTHAFRNGLLLAAGLVFGIQGLAYAIGNLIHEHGDIRTQTSYLLQLSELPCLFTLFLGLSMWLNFRWINDMYIYWPIILIALTVMIVLLPAPVLYHQSRSWWAYSNWRLMLAGLYPVEFRDFFLGDMYCSQTYAMGNIALFSCLYSSGWENPATCNSSNSRALGFLTTLPSIWRGFQCLRRYRDTRNAFPHLVNFGKYGFSILYFLTLSLYRIEKNKTLQGLFITCAFLNAVYSSIWDLAMDWSLGNPYSKNPFLRDFLGFRRKWVYYAAMIVDPILRFNWIFYAIFTHNMQHSAVLSFVVSLSEIFRRGIWSIFRVENEHCTNVGRFRASRDIPLPYDTSSDSPSQPQVTDHANAQLANMKETALSPKLLQPMTQATAASTTVDASSSPATTVCMVAGDIEQAGDGPVRRRRFSHLSDTGGTLARVGTMLARAHEQDFERKKRPGILDNDANETSAASRLHVRKGRETSSTDDEDEDEEEDGDEDEDETECDEGNNRRHQFPPN